MTNRMNYLLLITVMIAVIDNSYGRCCPCEKEDDCDDLYENVKLIENKNVDKNNSATWG